MNEEARASRTGSVRAVENTALRLRKYTAERDSSKMHCLPVQGIRSRTFVYTEDAAKTA